MTRTQQVCHSVTSKARFVEAVQLLFISLLGHSPLEAPVAEENVQGLHAMRKPKLVHVERPHGKPRTLHERDACQPPAALIPTGPAPAPANLNAHPEPKPLKARGGAAPEFLTCETCNDNQFLVALRH